MLRQGLICATLAILKLESGALLTAGLPCKSFIFLNQGTAQRSEATPIGNESLPYIIAANLCP